MRDEGWRSDDERPSGRGEGYLMSQREDRARERNL